MWPTVPPGAPPGASAARAGSPVTRRPARCAPGRAGPGAGRYSFTRSATPADITGGGVRIAGFP